MQSGYLFPSVMDAHPVLALFFLVVFVLGFLAAPIIWLCTAVHDRKDREPEERKLTRMGRARPTGGRHRRSTLEP